VLGAGLGAEAVVGPALALGTPGPGVETLGLAGPFLRQLLALGGGRLPACFGAVSVHPCASSPPLCSHPLAARGACAAACRLRAFCSEL
jgi:hypothetical protein